MSNPFSLAVLWLSQCAVFTAALVVSSGPVLMINGMPGPMATEVRPACTSALYMCAQVVKACLARGVAVAEAGFTGPGCEGRVRVAEVCSAP
jgi:hypothetical protein